MELSAHQGLAQEAGLNGPSPAGRAQLAGPHRAQQAIPRGWAHWAGPMGLGMHGSRDGNFLTLFYGPRPMARNNPSTLPLPSDIYDIYSACHDCNKGVSKRADFLLAPPGSAENEIGQF